MSAQWQNDVPALRPMTVALLDAVMSVETQAYAFPWTRGNFIDSLAAGYPAEVLQNARGELLGYFVAMGGVDEVHLLNITVAPAVQGRGHARVLFEALTTLCRAQRAGSLWLEVRAGNAKARAMYRHLGFAEVGVRKGYYPAPHARREDAIVMRLRFEAQGATDALG